IQLVRNNDVDEKEKDVAINAWIDRQLDLCRKHDNKQLRLEFATLAVGFAVDKKRYSDAVTLQKYMIDGAYPLERVLKISFRFARGVWTSSWSWRCRSSLRPRRWSSRSRGCAGDTVPARRTCVPRSSVWAARRSLSLRPDGARFAAPSRMCLGLTPA